MSRARTSRPQPGHVSVSVGMFSAGSRYRAHLRTDADSVLYAIPPIPPIEPAGSIPARSIVEDLSAGATRLHGDAAALTTAPTATAESHERRVTTPGL